MAGVTARTTAELVNVNKTTAAYYFHRLRLLIYQNSPHLEMFEGESEADGSYDVLDISEYLIIFVSITVYILQSDKIT